MKAVNCVEKVAHGLSAEAVAVDAVLLHLVADDALGRVEELRGLLAAPARTLQGVLDDVALVRLDRRGERQARHRARAFGRLQARRQVVAVYDGGVADDD